MLSNRLFLWSAFALLLLSGRTNVRGQGDREVVPSQQHRQTWDFFSFISLLAQIGPPCTRHDGTRDWGPENGPRWRDCSQEATSPPSSASSASSQSSYSYASESATENGSQAQSGGTVSQGATAGMNLWMFLAAGSVVSALFAIYLGQKRETRDGGKHGMSGAIMRRKGAVSALAEGVFPSRGKEVEMKLSRPEYRLDMDPQLDMDPRGDLAV